MAGRYAAEELEWEPFQKSLLLQPGLNSPKVSTSCYRYQGVSKVGEGTKREQPVRVHLPRPSLPQRLEALLPRCQPPVSIWV